MIDTTITRKSGTVLRFCSERDRLTGGVKLEITLLMHPDDAKTLVKQLFEAATETPEVS